MPKLFETAVRKCVYTRARTVVKPSTNNRALQQERAELNEMKSSWLSEARAENQLCCVPKMITNLVMKIHARASCGREREREREAQVSGHDQSDHRVPPPLLPSGYKMHLILA